MVHSAALEPFAVSAVNATYLRDERLRALLPLRR
jgi:hypothetical protein